MKAKLISSLFLILMQTCFSQDPLLSYSWEEKAYYNVDSSEVWTVDVLNNFYFSKNGTLNKLDEDSVLKFSQSIKSLGKTTQLIPINTMKLIQFSQEQQRICYFDNTLSFIGDCVELSDWNIVYGSMIAASNQPDKIWVVDNVNTKLMLLSLQIKSQGQEIGNLEGILQLSDISQIIERNSQLYLLDKKKGVYIFDLYGSLIEFKEVSGVKYIDASETSLFLLKNSEMEIIVLNNQDKLTITLPVKNVDEFLYKNQHFFFRTGTNVHKFSLEFDK